MARIFITGSADGLGLLAAKELIRLKHQVVLHVRNNQRASQVLKEVTGAEDVFIADLSNVDETKALAEKANTSGKFDAVIHNAGVYQVSGDGVGADELPVLLTVNTLAPYILTCLINKPKRLIYLSSGAHLQGTAGLDNLPDQTGSKGKHISYSDTKLHNLIISKAVARKWPDVYSNAIDPGWVPTKMGGKNATDNLDKGFETQVWLAVSNEDKACVSGQYFYHKKQAHYQTAADDLTLQDKFFERCEQITGIGFK